MNEEKNDITGELPEGWKAFFLGELCEINIGKTPPRSNPMYFLGDRTWLSIRDLKGKEVLDSNEKITDEAVKKFGIRKVQKGTLMMSFKLTLGRLAFAGKDLYTNEAIAALPIRDEAIIDKFFLAYALSFIDLEEGIDNAVKGKTLNKKTLAELRLPVPPLNVQQSIVKQLNAIFLLIDNAVRLANENLMHISHILPAALNDVFETLRNGLKPTRELGEIIEILTDYHANGSYETLREHVTLKEEKEYALMVRATDLEKKNFEDNVNYIEENAYNYLSKTKVYGDEIIIPKIGTIGNVYLMPNLHRPVSLGMNLFMIRTKEICIPKFLYYFLISPSGKCSILERAQGAVTKTITKNAVRSIEVILPNTTIQKSVIKYLEAISLKQQQLHQQYSRKLQQLILLKASLLDAAFRGELTQQATKAKVIQLPTETLSVVAEEEAEYRTSAPLNIPHEKRAFAKQVLAGKIISLFKDDTNFTPIKFQKLQYLAEHIAQADLNWNYYYQSAGPYDNVFMHSIDAKLKRSQWFDLNGKKYLPLTKANEIGKYYDRFFTPVNDRLNKLFKHFHKASEAQSEIVATLYAVWNNLLIQKEHVTDETIVEKFYKWSERKVQYTQEQLWAALKWMRENDVVPLGFGKEIKKKKK